MGSRNKFRGKNNAQNDILMCRKLLFLNVAQLTKLLQSATTGMVCGDASPPEIIFSFIKPQKH